ncbi:MAG: metallophosphoesterase [Candidatus Contendobacter sp.]|nr:metallophosphoesterase [Candidatus Contendobacter sp.]
MPTPNDDRPIRILHLSDIHFRADKAWDVDPVLRALTKFITEEVKNGLIPDLVAITGDLAFAGTSDEYQLARNWLDQQLWPALPKDFPQDRLLLVPGNHDVDRKKVDLAAKAVQEKLLTPGDQKPKSNR